MSLFQASVLNSHLRLQDQQQLEEAYLGYTAYFHNPVIQENIRNSKEEQFQATFLHELFVKVLGYTLNPNPDYNLTTEFKNESNNRKADGAILFNGIAVGVIELKGTNTKDLESIRRQAFDYKANQKGCVYVITSNFEKLRFYVNDATEFEEFNLFELGREEFSLLWLCLQKKNIEQQLPLKIKEASLVVEEEITKKFYSDYSVFKRELYQDLVKRNLTKLKLLQPIGIEIEVSEASEGADQDEDPLEREKGLKLLLFKKSQKLIDRFLFVFFAEDRNLLPPNSTMQILDKWKADMDFGDERPIYELFKQYFGFLDTGRQGTASRAEIYAYNGGLFKPDEILDAVEIDSELLHKHTRNLASYDFESQVDVNILGHIFENSLNEIEGMTSEIEGTDFEKQKSKRKKDGVFYTPKYITKYIVENTVGKLCEEKKQELGFREEEYYEGRSRKHKKTISGLVKVLDDYREWLLQLTICDPACGSGAFLNQALDFLIKEHSYIDELKTKLLGGSLVLSDIETTILENNIYGVDINEESVEIAKLSLWLRTAQPRRKLNDLSSNIKCGNSLIDDPAVAGEKAFKWEEEFPEIFAKGGFDVVIGNPPYGAELNNKDSYSKFYGFKMKSDSYHFFTLKAGSLIRSNGFCGLIIPNSWMTRKGGAEFRQKISNYQFKIALDFDYQVFSDANIDTCIIIFSGTNSDQNDYLKCAKIKSPESVNSGIDYNLIDFSQWVKYDKYNCDYNNIILRLFEKILSNKKDLGDLTLISGGYKPYQVGYGKSLKGDFPQTSEDVKNWVYHSETKLDDSYFPDIKGGNINRYYITKHNQWVKWGPWLMSPKKYDDFINPKLVVREVAGKRLNASYDEIGYFTNDTTHMIRGAKCEELKFYLGIINSTLIGWFFRTFFGETNSLFPKIKVNELRNLPIKTASKPFKIEFVERINEILRLNSIHQETIVRFSKYLSNKYEVETLNKKLLNWKELSFREFIKEINKAIKKVNKNSLTNQEEFEWMELFEENKKKALELQQQIDQTDREIDQLVYELYELTEEEIKVVEGS